MLPIYPDSRYIALDDKELFDSYLSRYPQSISEMTFTNLFSWRLSKGYRFSIFKEHLLVFYDDSRRNFLQPIGPDPVNMIGEILENEPDSVFIRVDGAIASKLKGLRLDRQRDMDDYIYKADDLKGLRGDRFQAKRSFVRRCEGLGPEIIYLDEDNVSDFLLLQRSWCNFRKCFDDPDLRAECSAIIESLTNSARLGIEGICIKISGRIAGFAVYERLDDDTYVEHFEKADPEFVGIYQYLLFKLAETLPGDVGYLNREQDLGIPGLRKAKQSWNPIRMIEKFSVSKPI